MKRPAILIAVLTILAAAFPYVVLATQTQQRPAQKKEQTKKAAEGSLTGCMDQQDGQYVLVDDHSLKVVASLEAAGFPVEGFAKHVGHKVTVRGTSSPAGTRPVFKVRSIETVSETCAPQATQQGKM
jgi:hypothetical protein